VAAAIATAAMAPATIWSAESGALRVHNIFGSNMVIRRDKPITISGWSEPGSKVAVQFGGASIECLVPRQMFKNDPLAKPWLPLDWPESDDPAETLVDRTQAKEMAGDAAKHCESRRLEEARQAVGILEQLKSPGAKPSK
jgi:hypothetical protein